MTNSRNSVQLIGHLGKAPEMRKFENGSVVTNVSIATSDTYQNKKGEKVTETQWHYLEVWGKTAELMDKLCDKGSEVLVQGKLMHSSYEDKNGITRNQTRIRVNEFVLFNKTAKAS